MSNRPAGLPPVELMPLQDAVRKLRNIITVMTGGGRDPLQRVVTFGDLVALGLVNEQQARRYVTKR